MSFAAILADYRRQIEWLHSLITDPTGARYFTPKSPATRQAEFTAQLTRTADFLEFAGHPHTQFNSIHVAGTSGKGSVAAMLAAILTAAGQRTGRHISPFLQICNEKLMVDGRLISPSEFVALVEQFRQLHARWLAAGRPFNDLRFSEAWTALTFLWLAQQRVDWAVIETGLGGRFDPTNVLPARLAVITNVNLDHLNVLGPDLASVARHKAGIIKPGGLAITAETNPAALAIIEAEAAAKGARLFRLARDFSFSVRDNLLSVQTPFRRFDNLRVAIPGRFQQANAALAVAALDVLAELEKLTLPPPAIEQGLAAVRFPGRLELVQSQPPVILDGAHNPHKMAALMDSLSEIYPGRPITALVGMIRLKDAAEMIRVLTPHVNRFIATTPAVFGKPSLPPNELANIIEETAPAAAVVTAPSAPAGVELALQTIKANELLLVTGSLYLVGEAREYWYPQIEILRQLEDATVTG
ncbi:MAG: Folylpolyglutamate synthase [Anaerolineae bacterium]|nr:Folylpolyglutamate synthase [Anaerolineae bacterium]